MFYSPTGSTEFCIERNGISVNNVLNSLCNEKKFSKVQRLYPVTKAEIFACVDHYLDNTKMRDTDGVSFKIHYDENDLMCVNTEKVTDWVYFSCVSYGAIFDGNNLDDGAVLYSIGLEHVIKDILLDLAAGNEDFKVSELHGLVYNDFTRSYGKLEESDVEFLLASLNVKPGEQNNERTYT